MFTACIHCAGDLGRNEALEEFQVGKRLAFDARRGRLWVVCRHCERWNLSPLDERWEAIEAAERRFRDSRLRVSSDNVGMARLREGLDLIRIGDPLRPEMAAWRYGDQFGRRRQRQLLMTGGALAGVTVAAASVMSAGAMGLFWWFGSGKGWWDRLVHGNPKAIIARIPGPDGRVREVERLHARMSILERSDGVEPFWLTLRHRDGQDLLHGEAAMRAAAQLLPTVNRFGGSRKLVRASVDILEEKGSALEAIRYIQQTEGRRVAPNRGGPIRDVVASGKPDELHKIPGALHLVPARERLALEMALHEESERRAMDGELDMLERAWRDAEEIAKIADDLLVTTTITERLQRLRGHARGE